MRKTFVFIFLLVCLLGSYICADPAQSGHVQVELISDKYDIAPGESFSLSIHFKMDDHWHIYGKDPGDAGLPTKVEWILPDGFTAGEIEWPETKSIRESDMVTVNAYEGEVVLTSKIETVKDIVSIGKELIAANVTWLSCKEICVPGEAKLSLHIIVKEKHG